MDRTFVATRRPFLGRIGAAAATLPFWAHSAYSNTSNARAST